MSENPTCPYCGAIVPADSRQLDYDQKVQMLCRNCGGRFEYLPGFGSFSLPGQGPRREPRTSDGSYPDTVYESETPWTIEQPSQQQSPCGTCCAIICCIIGLMIIIPILFFGAWIFWFLG